MTILSSQDFLTTGFVHNKIIALPDERVIAVILGHCVFGADGKIRAKYFRNTLFTLDGRILAKENPGATPLQINEAALMEQGWEMITRVKDHYCPVIEPTEVWAGHPLAEYFAGLCIYNVN